MSEDKGADLSANDPIEKAAREIREHFKKWRILPVSSKLSEIIREAVEAKTKELTEQLKVSREEYADLESLYGYELEKEEGK